MGISKMILILFKTFLIILHEVRLTKAQDSETFDPIDDILGVFPTDVDTTVVSKTVSVTEEATQTTVPAVEDLVEARGEKYDLAPRDVPDMMVDIVIPSLLIAALFVGNALIVLIIYKYRKRIEANRDQDEGTFSFSAWLNWCKKSVGIA